MYGDVSPIILIGDVNLTHDDNWTNGERCAWPITWSMFDSVASKDFSGRNSLEYMYLKRRAGRCQ
jgi:hypothetical protein